MTEAANICATTYGRVYDFYIEREWLSRPLTRAAWGINVAPMYEAIKQLGDCDDGMTIADVPSGGGLALRGLSRDQNVRFLAVDIDSQMLTRTKQKATKRGLTQVETIKADMRDLPLETASIDLLCTFSGIHMISDPERAIAEFARVLKPGGRMLGSSFVGDGSRRQRKIFERTERQGGAQLAADAAAIECMLQAVGFTDVRATGRGVAVFEARRA